MISLEGNDGPSDGPEKTLNESEKDTIETKIG